MSRIVMYALLSTLVVRDEGVRLSPQQVNADTVNCVGSGVSCTYSNKVWTINVSGGGTGGGGSSAPVDATYWTASSNGTLTNESNLGALSTGLVLNTGGTPSTYAGASCTTGRFVTDIAADGTLTCAVPHGAQTRLGADVTVNVNDSYVPVFTVTGAEIGNSKNGQLHFNVVYTPGGVTTVGMQLRVRTADSGYSGICAFQTHGISGTAASATVTEFDHITIGAAPGDTSAAASCSAAQPCLIEVDCMFISDASAGDIILEAQLETGTTNQPIKAGVTYYTLVTN